MSDGERRLRAQNARSRPLRVGILCDGEHLAAWQSKCIGYIEESGCAEISLLIVNAKPPASRAPWWRRLRNKLASGLLLWRLYERFIVDRKSAAMKAVPLSETLHLVPRLEVVPVNVGKFRQAFPGDAVEAIMRHDLDVLLRFGFGILTGEILSLARYGLWSFHHGDPEHYRGAPPGFWEIHNGDAVTGVILQRLTETLDGGGVLRAGWFKTNVGSYPKSLDRILFGSAHFVAQTLVEVRRDPLRAEGRPIVTPGQIYRYPRTRAVLKFFAKSTAAWLKDQYISLFRHQQWTVGVVRRSPESICAGLDGSNADAEDVEWLPEPKGRFLADPFVAKRRHGQEALIIAEDFSWKADVGQISTVLWPFTAAEPRSVITSDFHMSYPYTLEHERESYCVPECAESGEVALYRFEKREDRWLKERIMMTGAAALDPTIFQHGDRWWLFCSDAERGANEFLCAWHAETLTGQWQPHASNPLKVDIRGARPAGAPFTWNGELIRPAQDCSRVYGGGITFNRILKLTPDEFAEEAIGKLMPERTRYRAGLHTISALGDYSVVDGARWTFVWDEFGRAVRKKLGLPR